jgi:FtsZ-binding cell division protein ZapB
MSDHETRKLTTDELYPHLYKSYKNARQTIGELESYVDELKFENEQLTKLLNILKTENEKIKSENSAQAPPQENQD